jgi:hypothetical protein
VLLSRPEQESGMEEDHNEEAGNHSGQQQRGEFQVLQLGSEDPQKQNRCDSGNSYPDEAPAEVG